MFSNNGSACAGCVVVDIDASVVVATVSSVRQACIQCRFERAIHLHDKRLLSVAGIPNGEMTNVNVWPREYLAVLDVLGGPAYVPETHATLHRMKLTELRRRGREGESLTICPTGDDTEPPPTPPVYPDSVHDPPFISNAAVVVPV